VHFLGLCALFALTTEAGWVYTCATAIRECLPGKALLALLDVWKSILIPFTVALIMS
jgi:hypothetical protein